MITTTDIVIASVLLVLFVILSALLALGMADK